MVAHVHIVDSCGNTGLKHACIPMVKWTGTVNHHIGSGDGGGQGFLVCQIQFQELHPFAQAIANPLTSGCISARDGDLRLCMSH
jgi:hypothetical protein